MAAGLKMPVERFGVFRERFTAFANAGIDARALTGRTEYDCSAACEELDMPTLEAFERFAPFGRENPGIRLRLERVTVVARPQLLGNSGKHLALMVNETEPGRGRALRVVAWDWAKHIGEFEPGRPFECIVEPKISRWKGRATPEAVLVDARFTRS